MSGRAGTGGWKKVCKRRADGDSSLEGDETFGQHDRGLTLSDGNTEGEAIV